MFGSHRHRLSPSGTFRAVADTPLDPAPEAPGEVGDEEDAVDVERIGDNGDVFLIIPHIPAKDRNTHGAEVAATRGAIDQFRNIPKRPPKGSGEKGILCLRCNKPGHFWRQCDGPFRQNLTPAKSYTGKGNAMPGREEMERSHIPNKRAGAMNHWALPHIQMEVWARMEIRHFKNRL